MIDVLDRLHGAGVVHRDLKPGNVLVTAHGQPVVVDFGGASLGHDAETGFSANTELWGTDGFVAPERRLGRGDARADLYSVGVMLQRALGEGASTPPAEVARAIASLTAQRPDDRPPTARAARDLLQGTKARHAPSSAGVETVETLTARIAGPERLLHLESDATDLVLRETHGEPRRVEQLLAHWLRARIATMAGGKLRLDRQTLDRLRAASRRPLRQTPRAWLRRAHRHLRAGQLALAEPLLRDAFRAASAPPGDDGLLQRAASLWLALVHGARHAGYRARFLYELARCSAPSPTLVAIEELARAMDDATKWTAHALERARRVPRFQDRLLEQLRWHVRIFAARKASVDVLREEIAEAERAHPRTTHPSWQHAKAVWRGRLLYVEERYVEAARSQLDAARWASTRIERFEAELHAASAWMEAFELEAAIAGATRVRDEAAQCRLPFYEGRAEWILRSAKDRAGMRLEPDFALVHAAEHLNASDLVLLLALSEATIAYRTRDGAAFRRLHEVARRACGTDNEPLCMASLAAMAVDLGLHPPPTRPLASAQAIAARGVPRLALEVVALSAPGRSWTPEEASWLLDLAAAVPGRCFNHSLGVLSARECLERLGLPEPGTAVAIQRARDNQKKETNYGTRTIS